MIIKSFTDFFPVLDYQIKYKQEMIDDFRILLSISVQITDYENNSYRSFQNIIFNGESDYMITLIYSYIKDIAFDDLHHQMTGDEKVYTNPIRVTNVDFDWP